MADTGEKKRRKVKDESKPPEDEKPPRRARGEKQEQEGDEMKSSKRGKKSQRKLKVEGEEKTEEQEAVVIDMPEPPPVEEKKPKKSKKRAVEVEVEGSSSSEKELKMSKGGKGGKGKTLAQSRKWDQEELEVIVPDEEESEEGGEDLETIDIMDAETAMALPDDEKEQLDWLTRVMPDEVLRNIYAHMEAPVMDRTALVCQRMNNMVQERQVWEVYRPEWTSVPNSQFNSAKSRSAYAACYNHEMKQRAIAQRHQERLAHQAKLRSGSEWAKGFMTLFLFNRSVDYLSVCSFILGTCFAAARCQETITWNWRIVLIPFYIPMLQLWITPLVYDLCRKYYTSTNIDEIAEPEFVIWHVTFVKYRKYRPIIYLNNLALAIFWILLMIKLNDKLDGIPAGPLIIPWLLFAIAFILEQMFGWASGTSFRHGSKVDRMYLIGTSLIISLQLFFLVFKLDGVIHWRWVIVLAPLWAFFTLNIFLPPMFLFFGAQSYSWRRNIRLYQAEGGGTACGAFLGCTLLLALPLATWFVLASINLDGYYHRSWPVIFIPIFIIQGLILLFCGFLDIMAAVD